MNMKKKATIKREALIAAVDLLDKVTLRKPIISSAFVRMVARKNKLYMQLASDSSVTTTTDFMGDWPLGTFAFFINRNVLFPFVRVGKSYKKDFAFLSNDGRLLLRQGARGAQYTQGSEPPGYPGHRIQLGNTVDLCEECLKIINAGLTAASRDEREPEINCVHVSKDGVVRATDNLMMFISQTPKTFKRDFPLSISAVPLLGSAGVVSIGKQAVILDFTDVGQLLATVSDDASKLFPVALFTRQLKEFTNIPVQIKMTVGRFHRLIVENFKAYVAKLDKPTFLSIMPGTGMGNYAFSIHVRGGDTTFLAGSVSGTGEGEAVEQTVSAKRIASIASMLKDMHPTDAEVQLRFSGTSHLLVEVEKTKVVLVRAMPGEAGVG